MKRVKQLKNNRYLQGDIELGKGAFAIVYPGKDLQKDKLVAIKKIDTVKHEEYIQKIDQECQLHQSLPKNNHVLEFIDNFNEKKFIYIITELCEFGDLDNFLSKFEKKTLPEDVARLFTYQILMGFLALYDLDIIHRDMKLQNILVNKNFDCKIADFGLAKSSQDLGQTQAGTPLTMAPEVLLGESYNKQCDVWSFGCIVYAMTHGKYPFFPTGQNKRMELEHMVKNRILTFDNPNVSPECKQFIDKTLQVDPNKRIQIFEMFQEPWLQQCFQQDYGKEVINKYLIHLPVKDVHIDNEFAEQFGLSLRKYIDVTINQHCTMIESVYYKFITKDNQTNVEKKILYLMSLLITKMCDMQIEFIYKEERIKLPLLTNHINKLKDIISEDNYRQSKAICEKSMIDLTPVLQTLNTTLLQLALQGQNSAQFKNEFEQVISLIDLLTDERFGLPFEVRLDQNSSHILQQMENISIKEAYLDLNEDICQYSQQDKDHIIEKANIKFVCETKNFYQIPAEKQNLQYIKQLLKNK